MNQADAKSMVSEYMNDSSLSLADQIFDNIHEASPEYITDDIKKLALPILQELVEMISFCLKNEVKGMKEASLWGKRMGEYSLASGNTLDQTLFRVTYYKRVIWSFVSEHLENMHFPKEFLLEMLLDMDIIFNTMVSGFTAAFTEKAYKDIRSSEEKYLSVSTPIVPILPNLAVLPLIGEIDERRAAVLLEKSLFTCKQLNVSQLIIDLSGTYQVDDFVIENLMKLIRSLKLLGVKPILTGVRAEIGQQIALKGISLPDVEVHQTIMHVMASLKA